MIFSSRLCSSEEIGFQNKETEIIQNRAQSEWKKNPSNLWDNIKWWKMNNWNSEWGGSEKILKKNGWLFSKLDENYELLDLTTLSNL